VGDVAGMAADVYESYIVTVTAAIFLAYILGLPAQYIEMIILFATLALMATFVGVNLLKTTGVKHPLSSISMAIYATIALSVGCFSSALSCWVLRLGGPWPSRRLPLSAPWWLRLY